MKSSLQKLEDQVAEIEKKKAPSQISLLGRAIRYLSNREHSELELKRKLAPHAQSEEELSITLQKLLDKGLLSNARFTESLISRKSSKYGSRRISQELQKHHVDPEVIQQYVLQLSGSEKDRAFLVWQKKFGEIAIEPKEISRQVRYLMSKGFPQELVLNIVKGKTLDC